MARRATARKTKGNVVTLDFTGVDSGGGGGFRIPEGSYQMKVESVEQKESEAGNDMFKWTFVGTEGKAKGKKFYQYTVLTDNALWKLRSLLEALGQDIPDGPMDLDLDEMVDLELTGIVSDDTYDGKKVSRLSDFSPAGEAEEEDDDKPARRGKEDDDEEEDKPKGKAAKKSKKLEPLEADEVRAMDEDNLSDVIEKYGLEVDLAKYKTPRRMASAVVAALEEADLIASE